MKEILNILKDANLKITPQRIVVLQAVLQLDHPTVDQILKRVGQKNPSISQGTVYKTLQTLVEKGIIERVKTDTGKMRYDAVQGNHHHLYSIDSERIDDYSDSELDDLLEKYFERKKIPGFEVLNVRLQITGEFNDEKNRK
jgi:Fur family peroxide stress response transcriptional regulator